MIPNTEYALEVWEHVTCFKNVILAYEGDRSGLRGYLALGTTYWLVVFYYISLDVMVRLETLFIIDCISFKVKFQK